MDAITLEQPTLDQRGDTRYEPCEYGLHLCGFYDDGEGGQPYTALNIIADDADQARAMFEAAKAEAGDTEADPDFVCDLMLGGDAVEDFSTNRQMVQRLFDAAVRAK